MKKLLLIASVCFLSTLSYANTKSDTIVQQTAESALKAIPDSSLLTVNKVYEDVKSGLKGLASALKVSAEYVYEVLIKQQYVYAITYLTFLILSIILIRISYKIFVKSTNPDWENPNIKNLTCILSFVVGIIIFSFGIFNVDMIITGFINPEYGAIKEIMTFVK